MIEFIFQSLKSIVPTMPDPSVIFSDGCIEDPDLLARVFPSTKLLLCCFHIFAFDLHQHLHKKANWNDLRPLLLRLRDAHSEEEFENLWRNIQDNFSAATRY